MQASTTGGARGGSSQGRGKGRRNGRRVQCSGEREGEVALQAPHRWVSEDTKTPAKECGDQRLSRFPKRTFIRVQSAASCNERMRTELRRKGTPMGFQPGEE